MISQRKMEALQNLAERPGTEAEGLAARAMILKLTGQPYKKRRKAAAPKQTASPPPPPPPPPQSKQRPCDTYRRPTWADEQESARRRQERPKYDYYRSDF